MKINKKINAGAAMARAIESGKPEEAEAAWNDAFEAIAQSIRDDFEDLAGVTDAQALASRGYRQLTAAENRFYEALSASARADNAAVAKQTFLDVIGSDADEDLMPVTIIEDVFKDLVQEHELLQVINFTYTGYATKWIRNAHQAAKAVWGKVTDAVIKEITSGLKTMKIEQNKLSSFLIIPLDIIDMGHTFMDAYARACLKESIYDGLEAGIVSGTGIDMPVGLDRDVHDGVSFNTTTGYPKKKAIKVTSFDAVTYLGLVAKLAKTEKGKNRKVPEVVIVCNQTDYLTKVAPASTLLTQLGYQKDVFPYATKPVISNEMADGEALMLAPGCYTFCVGGTRNGVIDTDDSFKFLDDARTYKIIQHGDGIADDDTAALLLDISELEALVPAVKVAGTVNTTSPAGDETGKGDQGGGAEQTPTV